MAFDVTGLPAYGIQDATQLVAKTLFTGKTAQKIKEKGNIMVGVKSTETINIMDTDAVFQAGGTCGFTSSGATAFTQRTVTVGKIKVQEGLCPKDHEAKYTQQALKSGSLTDYNTEIYAQQYTDLKIGKVAEALEVALWQGDTASATVNLQRYDGLLKLIDAATTEIIPTPAGVITKANAIAIVDSVYAAIPSALLDKDDLEICLGWTEFRLYCAALRDLNLFHYDATAANGSIFYPGTSIPVTAYHGLSGTNRIVAFRWSNVYMATDMENEEEKFDLFFAKEADQVRFNLEFKQGVNVAFPNEIVIYKAA